VDDFGEAVARLGNGVTWDHGRLQMAILMAILPEVAHGVKV